MKIGLTGNDLPHHTAPSCAVGGLIDCPGYWLTFP